MKTLIKVTIIVIVLSNIFVMPGISKEKPDIENGRIIKKDENPEEKKKKEDNVEPEKKQKIQEEPKLTEEQQLETGKELKSLSKKVEEQDAEIDSLEKTVETLVDKIAELPFIKIGLSVGERYIIVRQSHKRLGTATISPIDSTLQIDKSSRASIIISAVILAYPFEKSDSWYRNLGAIANVNIAGIGQDGDFSNIFNEEVEGGLGVALKLTDNFSMGFTYEKVIRRRIRNYVFNKRGQQIIVNGKALSSINKDDDRFFFTENLCAFSIKAIYNF